jgi:hypothetical protein
LPSADFEFDNNDVTICCNNVTAVSANTDYWGYYNLPPQENANWNNKPIVLECELGYYVWRAFDSYPIENIP